MTKAYYKDFNMAESSGYSLIPSGTIAKATITLKHGNYGEESLLTKNEKTGSIGLSVTFTITEGKYKGRKIFQLIGIEGFNLDLEGKDKWGSMGRKLIRTLLESARGIAPEDISDKAMAARLIKSHSELDNLSCLVKIGIEEDKTGQYSDKNKVTSGVTTNQKEYAQYYGETAATVGNKSKINPSNHQTASKDTLDDEIPF